jgi:hypothetical protein
LNKADLIESCKLKCKSNQLNNAAQQNKDETHNAKIKSKPIPKTSTACNQAKTLKKNAHSDADLKIKNKTNENNNPNRSKQAAFCKSETKVLTCSKPIRKSNSEFANLSNKRDNDAKPLKKPIVLPARKNSINTDTVSSNSSDLKPLSEKTNTKIQILLTKPSPSPKQSLQRNEDDTDLDVSDLSPFGSNKNEESKDFDANSVFSYLSTTSSTDSLKQTKAKTDRLVNSLATDFSIKKSKKNDCKRRINFKSSGSCISTSESEQDSAETTSTASSRKSKNNSLDALPTLLVQLLVLLLSQNETGHPKSNQRRHSAMSMSSKNKINLKNQLKTTPIGSLLSLNKKGNFNHLVDSLTRSLRKVVDSKNNSVDRSEQKLLESILLNDGGNKKCGNDNDGQVKLTSSLVVDNSNPNASIFDTFSNISSPNPTFETVEPSANQKARINSSDYEEINFYYDYFMKNKQAANPDECDAHSLNLNSTSTKIDASTGLQCEDSAKPSHKKHQKRSPKTKPFLEIPNIDDPILFIDTLYNQLLANKSSKDDDSMSMHSSKSTTSCTNTNASDYSSYFKRFKLSDYSSHSAYLKNYCLVNNISCASNENNEKEGLSDLSRNESSHSLSSRFNNSILNFNNDEEMCQTDNTFNNNYYNNNDFSFIDLYSNKTNLSNTSTTTKDCLLSINKNLIDWNYDDEDSKMMAKIELSRDEPLNCSTARCSCLDCVRVNNTKASTTSSSSSGSSYIENKRFSKNDESVLFKNSLNETQDDIDASLASSTSSSSSNQLDVDYMHNFMRNSSEKLNTTQSDFNSSLLAASLSSNKSILPFGNTNINSNKNILRFSSLANIFSSSSMFHASNHHQKNKNKNMLMNCKYITNSNSAALRIFKSNSTSNVNSLNSNSNNYASLMICTKANSMKSSATSPIIVKNGSATTSSNTNYVQMIFNSFLKSLKFLIMTKNVFVLPIIIILLNTKFRNSSTVMSSASMSNIPGSAITIAATTAAAAAQLSEFYNR